MAAAAHAGLGGIGAACCPRWGAHLATLVGRDGPRPGHLPGLRNRRRNRGHRRRIGAAVLGWNRKSELTPAWIALVIGLHFVPLASLLDYSMLYVVAVGVVAVAVAAVPVARSRALPLSAITGVGTGSVLLAAALISLVTVVR
jgi:hypothetical protein